MTQWGSLIYGAMGVGKDQACTALEGYFFLSHDIIKKLAYNLI
jgi:hypothetical protein